MKKFYLLLFVLLHSIAFSQNIFNDVNENAVVKESQQHYLNIIKANDKFKRLKLVKLTNLDFLNSDKIGFKLFSDTLYSFTINKLNRLDSVSYSFSSKNNSNFISFVIRNGKITGTIQVNNKQYSIIPLDDSIHAIIEVDYSKLKPEAPPVIIENENKLNKSNAVKTGHSTIDILVAYTTAAKNAVSDIVGLIQNAIYSANSSFVGDDIDLEYNLVLTTELNYSEGTKSMDDILYDFRTNTTIQNLRNEYSADLCFLITNRSDISGDGYLIEYPSQYTSYAGYAIANYNRVRDTYTLGHETGHNLGARHDTTDDHGGTYNHGFRYPPGQWCTIMSYYTTETRQNFWSNPNKSFQGVTRGNTTYSDNERKLNEDRGAVSLFREPQLSGTLSQNQTLSGRSFTLAGNLSVPSGKTLKIESTATLVLNGYYVKSTGGTIIQQSGSTITGLNAYLKTGGTLKGLFSTVQSAIDNGSSGQTVELLSKTYSGNIIFSSKNNVDLTGQGTSTINNGSISVTNSSYVDILNLKENSIITINSSSHTNLNSITFMGSTIVNDYSGTYTNLGYSTALTGGASFAYNSYGGTGDIYYNNIQEFDVAVYLTSNGTNYNVGTNNTFCSNLLDIGAYSGAYAYAISNTYSRSLPGAVGGNVFTTGQNHVCGLGKDNLAKVSTFDSGDDENFSIKYLEILRKISEEKLSISEGINKYRNDFDKLILDSKSLLQNTNDPISVGNIISNLYHVYNTLDEKQEFYSFIKTKLSDSKFMNYKTLFEKYLVWELVDQEKYDDALNLADNLYKQSIEYDLKAELLYDQGLIYKYYLNSEKSASEAFNKLISNYKDNFLSKFAMNEMQSSGEEISKQSSVSDVEEVSLGNYPNPFNPITIISYSLPQKGHAEIKVFDVLGREISELVNENKEKGIYKIEFDGSSLASGLYIITLKAGSIFKSSKMLLIK